MESCSWELLLGVAFASCSWEVLLGRELLLGGTGRKCLLLAALPADGAWASRSRSQAARPAPAALPCHEPVLPSPSGVLQLLYDTFSAFGVIVSNPKIQRDPDTGLSRGFGFLSFDSFEASGAQLLSAQLHVQLSTPWSLACVSLPVFACMGWCGMGWCSTGWHHRCQLST